MAPEFSNPFFARFWSSMVRLEPSSLVDLRRDNLSGLSGRVLEVGAGIGSNFPHYPAEVTEVVALEPEPRLRDKAIRAAEHTRTPITVRPETVEQFDPEGDLFDAVVFCLVLCSVVDPVSVVAGLRRLLRPGGEIRFLEHVASNGTIGAVQRLSDATVWPRIFGNCHTHRDAAAAIGAAGFEVSSERREHLYPEWVLLPISPVVIGRAVDAPAR